MWCSNCFADLYYLFPKGVPTNEVNYNRDCSNCGFKNTVRIYM